MLIAPVSMAFGGAGRGPSRNVVAAMQKRQLKGALANRTFFKLGQLSDDHYKIYLILFDNIKHVLHADTMLTLSLPSLDSLSMMASNGGKSVLENPAFARELVTKGFAESLTRREIDLRSIPESFEYYIQQFGSY